MAETTESPTQRRMRSHSISTAPDTSMAQVSAATQVIVRSGWREASSSTVAIAEGRAFVETVYRNNPTPVRHELVPTAVFSMPPLAAVGLSESEARARHGEDAIDIYATMFRPMKNTLAGREERTFMKLVVDRSSQRVLGCHMVGADAPEIIQGLAVALTAGATKADFDRTLALHPTAAEEFVLMREPRRPPAAV